MNQNWQVWIDTGGTFTDCLAYSPGGDLKKCKVLSNGALRGSILEIVDENTLKIDENWDAPDQFVKDFTFRLLREDHPGIVVESYDSEKHTLQLSKSLNESNLTGRPFELNSGYEAPILAVRLVTQTTYNETLPPLQMRLATTKGTNALLEHKGVPLAFFVTKGFKDLLIIGNQQRPDLFTLNVQKPAPLYKNVVEVSERLNADGSILHSMGIESLRKQAKFIRDQGVTTAAVCFMHSYKNTEHEQQAKKILKDAGFDHISCSSDLAPFINILLRAETTVTNAYLAPVIDQYLNDVQAELHDSSLHIMTSAGGLVQSNDYHAKDSLLSGPAGGVVGASQSGKASGLSKIITFDMGGTSTDVSRFDGDFEYQFEHDVGDAHLVAPALSIETVAAGGGSVCSYDGFKLSVGPESAGAYPGPACYGAGGPLSITDVNLLLGHLDPSRFGIPVHIEHAKSKMKEIVDHVTEKEGYEVADEEILTGFLDIANERMADAIRKISLRKGYDPKQYAMVGFGGAGGQHVCGVAERLGISSIILPDNAGLLSAYGLGQAVIERFSQQQILKSLEDVRDNLSDIIERLKNDAFSKIKNEGYAGDEIKLRRIIINMRFEGQESTLPIDINGNNWDQLLPEFKERYTTIYGHWVENRTIEVESIRVVSSVQQETREKSTTRTENYSPEPHHHIPAFFEKDWLDAPVYYRELLKPGAEIDGPALVLDRHSTTVVDPGWNVRMNGQNALMLEKIGNQNNSDFTDNPEAVNLELFTNRFTAIASEMGEMLQRTALSVNVKERLDFSCALLDPDGALVVNAPHIPVHLGALGLCVRRVKEVIPMKPGDTIITNHPAYGGSHLPDITVITPVFLGNEELVGYVASRAHHAEVGGTRPGSMPPQAKNLAEEGVVISPTYLVRQGKPQWEAIRKLFADAPWPSRTIEDNMADLNAALAANNRGVHSLQQLCEKEGTDKTHYYMRQLKSYAEKRMRQTLQNIPDGMYKAVEELDDGTSLVSTIHIRKDEAIIDFTGTGRTHSGNLNATPAIVNSVIIYVLRLLVNEPLPLNEGLMKPISLHIPTGILSPRFEPDPRNCPAVVGGNTETSQRLVDTLLKAFKRAGCSQGTMNNVLFGNNSFGYYETVCGGVGAGPDFDGARAVHQHMTNTRITDAEIMEYRYPVRLERFEVRPDSGGKGKHRGGDGVIREITFLEPVSLSVLTQHRRVAPYGMEGGDDGKPGEQYIIRKNGERENLDYIDGSDLLENDRFILKTPGGGGYGQ
jgi:5-oxoprolinase (ATP-hydrolysing)